MLTNWVPRTAPGARVLQLGGGARQLYYYPKATLQVTVVGEELNKSLIEQAGVQAAVPTLGRRQPAYDLSFAPDASADAVVSLGQLAPLAADKRAALLAEAARVLRPGGVLVLVERAAAGPRAPASPLRALIAAGAPGGSVDLGEVDALRSGGGSGLATWSAVQYDLALEGQDPHIMAALVRGDGAARAASGGGGGSGRKKAEEKRERQRRPTNAKGF